MAVPALPFTPRAALAPLEGLTTLPIRDLFATRGGLGMVCTEFVRIHQPPSPSALAELVRRSPGTILSVQLMGNEPALMGDAARLLAAAGADVVDINLGCPTKRAVRGNVGAGLLRDHDLLRRVLAAMRAATAGCFSAKLRAGFDRADEACALGQLVADAGADFLVVHPRRRVDQYAGVADWRIVRELKRTLRIPVVGNGDAWYAAVARRLRVDSGCDGVMMGRPALRNPWIFRQLAELDAEREPFTPAGRDVLEHLEALADVFSSLPERRRLGALKEHVSYLGRAVPDGGAFRHAALRLASTPDILELARRTLSELPPGALDLGATPAHGLEPVPCALPG